MAKGITSKTINFSQWYNDLSIKAGLAETSAVRGCMTIKPYGFSIWERMQAELDKRLKETGHTNAYFPLFIPKSFFDKEASHVEGFAKECAVVTHYRLKSDAKTGKIVVDDDAKLEEELIVRPTSETIIWNSFKKWVQSYRDLPLLINQWANVVRWEMRTRLFLRTSEFLWQEGHTAHETKKEAVEEAEKILDLYAQFMEEVLAIPVIKGIKTDSEKFAGAETTYCVEALMQDGKALQAGTSHFLAQNFAKAFDVKFATKEGKKEHVWATSWGVSTRLIGGVIMTHSDDDGLILPPKIAPIQVVVIPVFRTEEQLQEVEKYIQPFLEKLKKNNISIYFDKKDTNTPGWKFANYELQGVPIRLTIGARDIENNAVEIFRRDTKKKKTIPTNILIETIFSLLEEIQENIFLRAKKFLSENTRTVKNFDEFQSTLKEKQGMIKVFWAGTPEDEENIKQKTKSTIRCIITNNKEGNCFYTGKRTSQKVLFAKAY